MNQKLVNRELYPKHIIERIKEIIIPEAQKVKFSAKIEGLVRDSEWRNEISEENLYTLMERDINACESSNMHSFSRDISHKLVHLLKEVYPDKIVYSTGHYYYPPTGYMGWHTNYKVPDDRVYITYTTKSKKSFFRYLENDKVVTDYDDEGFTFRRFSLSSTKPYFWHCVGSECDRFSFGFRICDIT